MFFSSRIGHFAADVGQRKAESLVEKSQKKFDLWYLPKDHLCSNAYWAKIARRWFRSYSLVLYLVFWNRIVPFGEAHGINSSGTHHSRDINGFLEKAQLSLPSTPSEEAVARRWMAQFGWKEGDPFVCLLVRDSKYLTGKYPQYDWNYHSYRDSDIKTYIKSIDFLVSQGFYVFRMGRDMARKVDYFHHKFVDYSFCDDRSDFLDVWLFANCSLCITTVSGPDNISDVFRRPILALNFLPLNGLWSWSNAIHYPKILKWKDSGRTLNLTEYLEQTHFRTVDFERAGIMIIDLNEDQIYEAVREAWQRVDEYWCQTEQENSFHSEFEILLISQKYFSKYHNFLHPDAKLASNFQTEAGVSRTAFLRQVDN